MLARIVLMGIQGSGKGTQARLISEKFAYELFETGTELRKISRENTPLGQEIRRIIDAGHYVEPAHIRDVIGDFITKNTTKNILLDSPIRSYEQDKIIRPMLGDFVAIHLRLNPDIAIDRLLKRRVDPVTGEVFGADFASDVNPRTGNTLVTRTDDNRESIENRIEYSLRETIPIVSSWEESGILVYHIDAENSVEDIFAKISQIIHS